MQLKLDLHVHSNFSKDGFATIEQLARRTKQIGLDGFALTDHNTIAGKNHARKIAKKIGIIIIPSIEVKAAKGDILGLGVTELIKKNLSSEETIDQIRKQGGLAIIPHPYSFILHPHSLKSLIRSVDTDAIEVLNGGSLIGNEKALMIANKRNLPKTAGSDAHLIKELGRVYTEIDAEPDINSILKAIKKGKTRVCGTPANPIILIKYRLLRLIRNII